VPEFGILKFLKQHQRALAKFWWRPVSLAGSIGFPAQELNKLLDMVEDLTSNYLWRLGMSSLMPNIAPRAMSVVCTEDELRVSLTDGRWLSVPLAWFPRLAHALPPDQSNYELLGEAQGQGIHWPTIDEDISVAGLIAGQPSFEATPNAPQSAVERTG